MKFEEKIDKIINTLEENLPVAGVANASNPAPVAGNPAVAPVQGEVPPTGQANGPNADEIAIYLANMDPNDAKAFEGLQGPDMWQAIGDHYNAAQGQQGQPGQPNAQMNPIAASNNTQTTSAAPASQNTAGVPGV